VQGGAGNGACAHLPGLVAGGPPPALEASLIHSHFFSRSGRDMGGEQLRLRRHVSLARSHVDRNRDRLDRHQPLAIHLAIAVGDARIEFAPRAIGVGAVQMLHAVAVAEHATRGDAEVADLGMNRAFRHVEEGLPIFPVGIEAHVLARRRDVHPGSVIAVRVVGAGLSHAVIALRPSVGLSSFAGGDNETKTTNH